jgi:hypothetical protein
MTWELSLIKKALTVSDDVAKKVLDEIECNGLISRWSEASVRQINAAARRAYGWLQEDGAL